MPDAPLASLPGDHTPEQYADFLEAMMKTTERPGTRSLLLVRDDEGNYFARGSSTILERAAMLAAASKEMLRVLNTSKERN